MRRLAVLALVLLSGCAITVPYAIRSGVNEATFYRNRYVERCVTARAAGVPCAAWAIAQRRLDTAALEAVEALRVGGSQKLQVAALERELAAFRKEFARWATQ